MKRNLRVVLALAMGWMTGTGAFAIEQTDGVYQIGTADELIEFAGIVNGGENGANAVLTADIDMAGKAWTPIGDNDHRYVGTFNGQYHMINNLKLEGDSKIGIFGVVNGGCLIKNLVAGPGNEIRGNSMIGGIIGCSDGSGWVELENVGHEGYVYGTGNNCCAFIGVVMNGGPATRMTNCYNTGNVHAGGESAIISGWFGGHGSVEVRGFWNTGLMESGQDGSNSLWRNSTGITTERIYHLYADQGATVIGEGDVASGKLAYQLNGNTDAGTWRQNLTEPKDEHPTFDPSHGLVYANGQLLCDGVTPKEGSSVTYSNTPGSTRDEHQFEGGICIVCHELLDVDGVYQLGCADALIRYSEIVRTSNGAANGVLTADIDMSGKDWTPIGQDAHDFKGHFDGQGHRILNLTTNADKDNQALFGQAVGGAIIENVVIDASCTIQGKAFTAGILGHVWGDGVIVRNCGNEAAIVGSAQNAAGIVGCSERLVTIENCYNLGTITGSHENAGICAWMGNNSSVIRNCYSTATDINGNPLWRKDEVQGENVYAMYGGQGQLFTEQQMKSGELAFLLNGRQSGGNTWYQVIGTNDHPVPFAIEGGIVYTQGSLNCDGTAKDDVSYVNVETEPVRDPHTFEDGICSVCGAADANYKELVDGAYELATAADLVWFAALVNGGLNSANAQLTADIDFSGAAFKGIGTATSHYIGSFDGKGHIVSNLTIDLPEEQNVGFFREIDNGAHLQNFTIDNSCSFNGLAFAGAFVGHASGNGSALLERLGNEGNVTTVNQNAGALVGCNTSGELKLTILNCYNAGNIASGWEAGGLSGWLGNDAVTTNCYNMGTVTNGESYARGNNIQITNCFDAVTDWPALNKVDAEAFTDGTVFAALSEAAPGVWFLSAPQGGHPVLYVTDWTSTAILSLDSQSASASVSSYNLQGQRVQNSYRGIRIVNGRKVLTK